MAKLRKLANRTKEFETFLAMAKGQHDCRILLIEGKSGMGKTSLLERFRQDCPKEVLLIPFQAKGIAAIGDFFEKVIRKLGKDCFPSFIKQLQVYELGGVDFSSNDISAKEISIVINAFDADSQNHRLRKLERAFFNDLQSIQCRIVILFDTYEKASDFLKNWIETKWLPEVEEELTNIVCIIAGQEIPNSNCLLWGDLSQEFILKEIQDPNIWCECFSEFPKGAIETIYAISKGHPDQFQLTLNEVLNSGLVQW
jgi:hypothetical protein